MGERTDRAKFGMILPKALDCVHLHVYPLARTHLYEDGLRNCRRWLSSSWCEKIFPTINLKFEDDCIPVCCLVVGILFHLE